MLEETTNLNQVSESDTDKPKSAKLTYLTNPIAFETEVTDLFRAGYNPEQIYLKLHNGHYGLSKDVFDLSKKENPAYIQRTISYLKRYLMENCQSWPQICKIYSMKPLSAPDSEFAPKITLLRFIGDSKHVYFFDRNTQTYESSPMDYNVIKDVVKHNLFKNKVSFDYLKGFNPTHNGRFYIKNGKSFFNSYNPPSWKADLFYGKVGSLPDSKIPEIYVEFLTHFFVDFNSDSCQFFLDWLAISLQARNRTFLCLVSQQGTGKGTLAKIVQALHSDQNSVIVRADSAGERFNGLLENKTFACFNEIQAYGVREMNNLKEFIDDEIRIERKGVDAVVTDSYINCLFNTNNYNALKIEDSDRRWSVLETTEINLSTVWPEGSSKFSELLEPENIQQFAQHLFNRKYNPVNVNKPFKSLKAEEMNALTLTDWEQFLENDFYCKYPGEVLKTSDLLKFLKSLHFRVNTSDLNEFLKMRSKNLKHRYAKPSGLVTLIPLLDKSGGISTETPFLQPPKDFDFKVADRAHLVVVGKKGV